MTTTAATAYVLVRTGRSRHIDREWVEYVTAVYHPQTAGSGVRVRHNRDAALAKTWKTAAGAERTRARLGLDDHRVEQVTR